jgi:hypothetical protein
VVSRTLADAKELGTPVLFRRKNESLELVHLAMQTVGLFI